MIESDPDFYGAYWLQGAIHLSSGEFDRAVEQLKTAVSLGGHHIVVADLASAYSLAGRDDDSGRDPASVARGAAATVRAGHLSGARLQPRRGHRESD